MQYMSIQKIKYQYSISSEKEDEILRKISRNEMSEKDLNKKYFEKEK